MFMHRIFQAWPFFTLGFITSVPACCTHREQASKAHKEIAPAKTGNPTLHARLELLCEQIDDLRTELHIPGIAIAVVLNDEVVLARGFGVRDIQKGHPVTVETLFAIGSCTKAFTSMLVAMLIDEGKMNWDDPVRRHIPFFQLKDEQADSRATIRDLLCHRTGLTRMGVLWAGNQVGRDEMLRQVAKAQPWAPFRTRFLYNSVMYSAAGFASARAAGTDWESLVKERILVPLEMKDTNTSVLETLENPKMAKGYVWDEHQEMWRFQPMRNVSSVAPAGVINSNVLDMVNWIRFLLDGGRHRGRRLVSADNLQEIWKAQIPVAPNVAYGFGWLLRESNGRRVIEHNGNVDGFAAEVVLFPEKNAGFVILANVTATPLQQLSVSMVWEALFGHKGDEGTGKAAATHEQQAAVEMTPQELKPYLGDYHLGAAGTFLTVLIQEGKLAVDMPGQSAYTLRWPNQEGKWVFELTNEMVLQFHREGQEVISATFHLFGTELELTHQKRPSDLPTVAVLMELLHKDFDLDRFDSIRNIRMTGDVHFVHQGLSGKATIISEGTDRYILTFDLGRFGRIQAALDGARAWTQSFSSPAEQVHGAFFEQVALQHPFVFIKDWRDLYAEVEIVGRDEFNGEQAYVVRTKAEHLPVSTKYVSVATGRLLGEDTSEVAKGIGALPTRLKYEDYRDVYGIPIPFRTTSESEFTGRIVVQIKHIKTNLDLAKDSFTLYVR